VHESASGLGCVKTCAREEAAKLYSLLSSPDGVHQLIVFPIGKIETNFPSANSISEFSHSLGRLCCKSRKLQGHEFFAKTRNGKQSPIRIDAIALSKSQVSLSLGDEAPHIFARKLRPRPLEFLIISAKRLLQHNRPIASFRGDAAIRSLSERSGHRAEVLSVHGLIKRMGFPPFSPLGPCQRQFLKKVEA
jgi:hypothetical protein